MDVSSPEFVAVYDDAPLWSARFGALLLAHVEMRRGLRVMDLGCGTGFPLIELANALGPTCRVTGVDIWEAALARADARRRYFGLDHVELVRADGAELPFERESFDLIVSNLGLNNFAEPEKTVAECARVLKKGGRLALTTNVYGHMRELYDDYRAALRELRFEKYLVRLTEHEQHRATRAGIVALFERAGLQAGKFVEDQFEWRFTNGAALLRHSFIRLGFLESWREVVAPEDREQVLAALEQRLDARAGREGCLKLTVPMLLQEATK